MKKILLLLPALAWAFCAIGQINFNISGPNALPRSTGHKDSLPAGIAIENISQLPLNENEGNQPPLVQGNCTSFVDVTCAQSTATTTYTITGANQNNFTLANDYASCVSPDFGFPMDGREVVFRIRVATARNVHIVFSPTTGVDLDYFFLSSCNPITCLAYSVLDNPSYAGYKEVIDEYLEANTDYFLIVDGKTAQNTGSFTLTVNCACTCTEDSNDLPDGNNLYCDDFQDRLSNGSFMDEQSSRWRRTGALSDDARVETFGGNIRARFRENAGKKPDVLYELNNRTTGRYRASWRMYLPTGKKGRFNVLHNSPDLDNGTGQNIAYSVYFDGNATGRLVIPGLPVVTFSYPENTWFDLVHIADLDANAANAPRSANLFVNNVFVQAWDFKRGTSQQQNKLSAIQFQAILGDDYYVDHLCLWAKKTTCPTGTGEPVCLKNGEQRSNAALARCDLFTAKEWTGCTSACDLGGTFIYRGDTYNGTLEASDYPFSNDPNDCGTPSALATVMDVYIFYKDDEQPLQVFLNSNNNPAVGYSIFACKVNRNGTCIRERGQCLADVSGTVTGTDLPCNNFYYITVYGPVGSTYTLNLFPTGPCETNPQKINLTNCSANVAGTVVGNNAFNSAGNAYSQCYNGNRSYNGDEKVYQFTLDKPTDMSIALNSTSAMGVFLYSFLCGRNCLAFAENGAFQSNAAMTARLAEGTYYLIVDKEAGVSNNFTLTLQCDNFSPFTTIQASNPAQVSCPLTPGEKHVVQLTSAAYTPALTVRDQIHFLYKDAADNTFKGHDSLIYNWNGSAAMNFNLYKDLQNDGIKCSYAPGDTFVVFLVQSELGKRSYRKLLPNYTTVNGQTFAINGQSVINQAKSVETVAFGTQTLEINPGSGINVDTLLFSTNLDWRVEEQPIVDWLSVTPTQSDGAEEIFVTVQSNESELPRSTVLQFYALQNPAIYRQSVLVRQRGKCNASPALAISPPTTQVCGGTPVTLSAVVAPGFQDVYQYRWSNSATTATIAITPTTSATYTVTISNKYCDASNTATATVNAGTVPSAPTNPTNVSVCQGVALPALSVSVGIGNTADWFDEASGIRPPLLSGSLTYTPNGSMPGTYVYYAQARNLTSGCLSSTRTPVTLTINTVPTLSVVSKTCAVNFATYSILATSNGNLSAAPWTVSGQNGNYTISNIPAGQNVTIIASNANCSVQLTEQAPVCGCPPSDPPVSGGNKTICSNQPVPALTATVAAGKTIDWYDGAGVLLLSGVSSYTPAAGGTFYAETRDLNTNCKSALRTAISLTILPLPALNITGKECAADLNTYRVTFTSNGAATATVGVLNNNNGVFTLNNIPKNTQTVISTTLNGCSNQVSVVPPDCTCPIVAAPVSGGNKTICSGQTVPSLTVTVGPGETADWYNAAGAKVATGVLAFQPAVPGEYAAEARNVINNCLSATRTKVTLVIHPSPVAVATGTACAPNLLSYTATVNASADAVLTSNVGTVSGNGGIYSISNIPANTNVLVTATSAAGCSTPLSIMAPSCNCPTVSPPVSGGDKTICADRPIPLLTVTVGPNETADWYNQAGAVVATGLTWLPNVPGTYFVEARNTVNGCRSAVKTPVTLVVNLLPSLNIVGSSCTPDLNTWSVNLSSNATVTASIGNVTGGNGVFTISGIPKNTNVVVTAQNTQTTCSVQQTINAPVCTCPLVNPPVSGGDKTICSNQPIPTLNVTVGPNETANWYDENGVRVASNRTFFVPVQAGTYFAEAQNTVNNCVSSTRTAVRFILNSQPAIVIVSKLCALNLLTYSIQLNTSVGVNIQANAGTVENLGGGSFRINAVPSGTPVSITATNPQTQCSAQITESALICTCPNVAAPVSGGNQTICEGIAIAPLSVTVGAGETANWYDQSGNLTAANTLAFTPTIAGTWSVEAENIASKCKSAVKTTISLKINPKPSLILTDTSCTPDRQAYNVIVSTNGATPTTSPSFLAIINGLGSFTFPNIPIAQSVVITARILATGCQSTLSVSKFSCPCQAVNAPVSGGDKEVCSSNALPALTVTTGTGETVNWYNVPTGGQPLANGTGTKSFIPPAPGTYYAQTQNLVSGCISAVRTAVKVTQYQLPQVSAGADMAICQGQVIALQGNISAALGGQWSADVAGGAFDPNNGFLNALRYSPPSGATKVTLTLTTNDPAGPCPAVSDQVVFDIKPLPLIVKDTAFCAPDFGSYSVIFSAEGMVTINVGTKIPLGNGRYAVTDIPKNVSLVIEALSNNSTCTRQLTITPPVCNCPALTAPVSKGDLQVCAGQPIPALMVAPPQTGQRIDWYNAATGGVLLLSNSPAYTPAASGVYYAETVEIINGCTASSRTPVSLNILPKPIADAGPDKTICPGDTAILSATNTNVQFLWDNGATTQSIRVAPQQSRSYTLKVTTSAGCSAADTVKVVVYPPIVAKIDSLAGILCFGQASGALGIKAEGGSPPFDLKWSNGKVVPQISGLTAGVYQATVTDQTGCKVVVNYLLKQPLLLKIDSFIVQNSAQNMPTGSIFARTLGGTPPYRYEWSRGGIPVSGENQALLDSVGIGLYSVKVIDRNNCTFTSTPVSIGIVGLREPDWAAQVKIYPNPTTGTAIIALNPEIRSAVRIQVIDVLGRILNVATSDHQDNGVFTIDLTKQPAGLYFINIIIHEENNVWKLILEK